MAWYGIVQYRAPEENVVPEHYADVPEEAEVVDLSG